MINITGLWKNKTKGGEEYLAGNFGGIRALVFKNNNKKGDNSPDYNLVFTENKKREKTSIGEEVSPDEVPEIDNNPFDDKALPF